MAYVPAINALPALAHKKGEIQVSFMFWMNAKNGIINEIFMKVCQQHSTLLLASRRLKQWHSVIIFRLYSNIISGNEILSKCALFYGSYFSFKLQKPIIVISCLNWSLVKMFTTSS